MNNRKEKVFYLYKWQKVFWSELIIVGVFFITLPAMFISSNGWADSQSAADLVLSARERTRHEVRYDGAYVSLAYPGGDVPASTGVCTDVLVRAYRGVGTDLQKLVHEDMLNRFEEYPSRRIWGLTRPDSNIDHRRVPNLQEFFGTHGQSLGVSTDATDYKPGDIVSWMLPGNLPHIGIVSDRLSGSGTPMIIHNIGAGPEESDMLFRFEITGHYRFLP